jgi:MHS family proline/betaine transporter-like MFS transporter
MTISPDQLRWVRRNGIAGAIGNVMEWYDFAAYAYMAPIISGLFFPSDDPFSSLLATYGAFAAGYLARPFGTMVFGHIGDRFGRKRVLIITVWLMGFATVAIGLLPNATQIGPAAAVLLVAVRILQGFSVGGEYTGSTTFVIEHAPPDRRAFYASWIVSGSAGGFLIGSAVATLLINLVDDSVLHEWAWRIPFLTGSLIALVAMFLRRHVEEPPVPEGEGEEPVGSPVIVAFRDHWRDMLRVMGLALSVNVGFYMMFVFAVSYLTDRMHIPVARVMDINTFCMVVLTFLPLPIALLADRIGRKPILLSGTVAMILLAWPLFWLMHHQSLALVFAGQLGLAIVFSWIYAAYPAAQVEIVPRRVRVSVLSIGCNIVLSVFGDRLAAARGRRGATGMTLVMGGVLNEDAGKGSNTELPRDVTPDLDARGIVTTNDLLELVTVLADSASRV